VRVRVRERERERERERGLNLPDLLWSDPDKEIEVLIVVHAVDCNAVLCLEEKFRVGWETKNLLAAI
jgi:hypothetical protein